MSTFKVIITEEQAAPRERSTLYTVLSALFSFTICCLCVLACCRCFLARDHPIDYNVDEADPNWD